MTKQLALRVCVPFGGAAWHNEVRCVFREHGDISATVLYPHDLVRHNGDVGGDEEVVAGFSMFGSD